MKFSLTLNLLVIVLLCFLNTNLLAQESQDVLELKNGVVLYGKIVELVEDEYLIFRTQEGVTRRYNFEIIANITSQSDLSKQDDTDSKVSESYRTYNDKSSSGLMTNLGILTGVNGVPDYLGMYVGIKAGIGFSLSKSTKFTTHVQVHYQPKDLIFDDYVDQFSEYNSIAIGTNLGSFTKVDRIIFHPFLGAYLNIENINYEFGGFSEKYREEYWTFHYGLEFGASLSNKVSLLIGATQRQHESDIWNFSESFLDRMLFSINLNFQLTD